MKFLLHCLLLFFSVSSASAQAKKLKPLSELLKPETQLVGLWIQERPLGDEYMTFGVDGRLIIMRGPGERQFCKWSCDTTTVPWKLDIVLNGDAGEATIYTVFEFPEKDQFRMAPPGIDKEKRPGAEELKKSPLLLKRVPLEPHGGLHQAVQAHLKGLSGTWQGLTNGNRGTATFNMDGTYSMTEGSDTDKGRFRIDVSKVPCKIDIISSEGNGPRFGLYELKGDKLIFSGAARKPAERPTAVEGGGEFQRKKE